MAEQTKSIREHAFNILNQTFFKGKKASTLLSRAIEKLEDGRDRRLLVEIVNGTLKMTITLDAGLDTALKRPIRKFKKNQNEVKAILRMGLFQILFLDKIPSYAIVNESVNLYKKRKNSNPHQVRLINAVLRRLADKIDVIGKDDFIETLIAGYDRKDPDYFRIKYSYPEYFVTELLKQDYSEQNSQTASILLAGNQTPIITLRVNTSLIDREKFSTILAKAQIAHEPGKTERAIRLIGPLDVTTLPGYGDGLFIVQDEAAQVVAPFLDPQKGEKIADLCAAPGGKTTHIFELVEGDAEIWAVDQSVDRMGELEKNLFRMQASSIRALAQDAKDFCAEHIGEFDKVLVDVPCSNSGVLRRRPEARLRLDFPSVQSVSDKSFEIADAAARSVKPGGALIFSTCSILPIENQGAVEKLLKSNAGFRLEEEKLIYPEPGAHDGGYMARLVRSSNLA